METLRFVYRSTNGELSQREVTRWNEIGHYIKGFSVENNEIRTFRKDRIAEYLDGSDSFLQQPFTSLPVIPEINKPENLRPQILFTGFLKDLRSDLEQKASIAGMQVCQTVTKNLNYLCIGANAGPAKVEKARAQHVYILNEDQLHALLETGELIDS